MIERRRVLCGTAAAGLSLLGAAASPAAWAALRATSAQGAGPFYPATKPSDQDTDLTVLAGRGGPADGQVIDLVGRVLTIGGAPVPNARVEIWQADSHGRYRHPRDRNRARLDKNFQGYGVATTDADGRYGFKTILPGAYPTGGGGAMRPPHIHFAITGRSERLITQMYFPDEPLNATDWLLRGARNPEGLIAALTRSGGVWPARWDIVLTRG